MLAQLTISNFAIVRELEIDFHSGMTAITGETGAGKSIAIDALGCASAAEPKQTWCARRQPCRPVRPLRLKRYSGGAALAGREPAGKRT
jgi:ABC-type lipoprotein export system ATPase subunit